jgi:signal transduction histidine kinase
MRYLFTIFLFTSFPAVAQQSISMLKAKAQKASEPDKIKLYKEISRSFAQNSPDSAVDYCNRGIRLAERLNDRNGQALLLLELGKVNAIHHRLELARRFENEALSIFRNINNRAGIAIAYQELGLLGGQQKDVISATHFLAQAMDFYQDKHDSAGMEQTYQGLGTVYEEKGDIDKALSYNLRALSLYKSFNPKPVAYFDLLTSTAKLYLKKGDRNSALRYFEKGIQKSILTPSDGIQINFLEEEGKVYAQAGEKAKALEDYKDALEEAKKYNQPEAAANALISIASLLKKKNAKGSLTDLKEALLIAQNQHQPELEARIYAAMSSVYEQDRDFREAMLALEENHRLLDSLLREDTTKEISALDSSYQLESSREQIGQLKQNNRQEKEELEIGLAVLAVILVILLVLWLNFKKINKLNNELETSNRIKDTLFSVIGHDLKGPTGAAMHLFNLMETEDFDEQEFRSMIAQVRKQTAASFELLNALFSWGKAQMEGVKVKVENFDAKPLIARNINLLSQQAAHKKIQISDYSIGSFSIHADPDHFDFVIRNLLSNAIKFTHESGSIVIRMNPSSDGMHAVFSVKDNGIGISKEKQKEFLKGNMQLAFGTRGEKGSGLGLLLIKDFLKANKGRIWIESKEEEGTIFYFTLLIGKEMAQV